jgi:hypothetical protein
MEHVMKRSFGFNARVALCGLAFWALSEDASAAPRALSATTGKPVAAAPASWRGVRAARIATAPAATRADHRRRPVRGFGRFAPAYLEPVAAAAPRPVDPVVQQPVTVVQQAPAADPYLATLCSGPLIISIEPNEPPSRHSRHAHSTAGTQRYVPPTVVYGSPLPCPAHAGLWRRSAHEAGWSGAY